jgi:hypothetical protein
MAEREGGPDLVGLLVISWDSLGQWIFRVGQNDRYRHRSLSEPEAQPEMDGHAVQIPAVKSVGKTAILSRLARMNLNPCQAPPLSRKSG